MLKLRIFNVAMLFLFVFAGVTQAQVNKISLTQIPGEFTTESLNLEAGDYQFEIVNDGVDHEVGFVLAPKGKTDAANHIKAAYVTAPVKEGTSSMTKVVSLEAGNYVYFCPLNPTEQYDLTVTPAVNKIKLTQIPGEFTTTSLALAAGDYQFEIANKGVDHEVGFVLAPKGKTDAANHIKAAYVTAPVKEGTSSMTKVVSLEAGNYVYFCPLNPTEQYDLTVTPAVNKIKLTQIPGEFTTTSLALAAGDYQFEIANKGVGHEVGFVLAPKGKTDAANHIKAAYVTAPVKEGTSSLTKVVSLEAGNYVYFCPLNPTKQYDLTVTPAVNKIKLTQIPGEFTTTSIALAAGDYQFEIANKGVDHEVGFVLAPKGKTDAANHIKAAYVTAPVKEGTSSLTKVVSLEAGNYVYFCPLNPTKQYDLVVK